MDDRSNPLRPPRPLVFMMGRSPAMIPVDRRYARNHMWASPAEAGGLLFGLSAYAVRLLGDVKHLAWTVAPGAAVAPGQALGYIEASKATSDLYAPAGGRIEEIHAAVLADPGLVSRRPYHEGWLLRIAADDAPPLLTPAEYLAHLEANWPLAQRLLKA